MLTPKQRAEAHRWLDRQLDTWNDETRGEYRGYSIIDLMNLSEPPNFVIEDMEQKFRIGYSDGYGDAVQHVYDLKNKGFSRPVEVGNILNAWWYGPLMRWRYDAVRDVRRDGDKATVGVPRFKQASWWEIRKQVFKRDGYRCQSCGRCGKLECHHTVPVEEGGLPLLDDLKTLCKPCHRPCRVVNS